MEDLRTDYIEDFEDCEMWGDGRLGTRNIRINMR